MRLRVRRSAPFASVSLFQYSLFSHGHAKLQPNENLRPLIAISFFLLDRLMHNKIIN